MRNIRMITVCVCVTYQASVCVSSVCVCVIDPCAKKGWESLNSVSGLVFSHLQRLNLNFSHLPCGRKRTINFTFSGFEVFLSRQALEWLDHGMFQGKIPFESIWDIMPCHHLCPMPYALCFLMFIKFWRLGTWWQWWRSVTATTTLTIFLLSQQHQSTGEAWWHGGKPFTKDPKFGWNWQSNWIAKKMLLDVIKKRNVWEGIFKMKSISINMKYHSSILFLYQGRSLCFFSLSFFDFSFSCSSEEINDNQGTSLAHRIHNPQCFQPSSWNKIHWKRQHGYISLKMSWCSS